MNNSNSKSYSPGFRHGLIATIAGIGVMVSVAQADDGVLISTSAARSPQSSDDKALTACMQAFIARIMPGAEARVTARQAAGLPQIFNSYGMVRQATITMTANRAKDDTLLASGRCVVSDNARVETLRVTIPHPEALAALKLRDIHLASR